MSPNTPWQHIIRAAQLDNMIVADGRLYTRIPYTKETMWGPCLQAQQTPCRDCGVQPGELHVPTCCVEQCPICHEEQRISCYHWFNPDTSLSPDPTM